LGARLVAGTSAAEGHPSGLFVAHAAAISEVWLSLVEHGPSIGIAVSGWLTDRAGWQEWTRVGRWTSHPSRLTPDAVVTLTVDGADVAAFVEVDLASMTQTLLKQKVIRYAAYAADQAWADRHPGCPPMLLLTTTPTRAATFARAASQVLRRAVLDSNDPAATLVIAACGLVRDPARAVAEPCWSVAEPGAAELTLAELLAERASSVAASRAWHVLQSTVVRRRNAIEELGEARVYAYLDDRLGSERAGEALRFLIGADPEVFLDAEPDLAEQVLAWFDLRRKVGRFTARSLARELVVVLEARHDVLWREQARRLLDARDHVAAEHPHLLRLASILASGRLADLALLDRPPGPSRDEVQAQLLGDYPDRRAASVAKAWSELSRRDRRRVTVDQLVEAYDAEGLLACESCGLAYPAVPEYEVDSDRCAFDNAVLVEWDHRPATASIAERLATIRRRLIGDSVSLR
jgi:hypothetical protein